MAAKIFFFSRDVRTHNLFRGSWHRAVQEGGVDAIVICRGFGLKNVFISIFRFIFSTGQCRVLFGTSEICLYSLFSTNGDVWVFTGLGRLLLDEGYLARFVRSYLRSLYRGQRLVVLNEQDQKFMQEVFGRPPFLLNGEGYQFSINSSEHKVSLNQRELTFAYVGRLLKSKGVDQLVTSFAKHSLDSWTLMVIGDSDFSNKDSMSLIDLDRLGKLSKGKILYTGFQKDVGALINSADFLISLSRREGLPFSVLDGIEAGLHIALSPVPGHLSFSDLPGVTFVKPGELGIFFERVAHVPSQFLIFDRVKRIAACRQKFSREAVVEKIKYLLFDPTNKTP